MLSTHDALLLKDLRMQPLWLLWAYIAVGTAAAGVALWLQGLAPTAWLGVGGGFLLALGAEKLVTRRIRRAAQLAAGLTAR